MTLTKSRVSYEPTFFYDMGVMAGHQGQSGEQTGRNEVGDGDMSDVAKHSL